MPHYSVVQCRNQLREYWEDWRIIEPRSTATTSQMQYALDPRYTLANKDRQNFVMDLVKCGRTLDEIEQIVTSLFDGPAATTTLGSAVAVSVTKG